MSEERKMPDSYVETVVHECVSENVTIYSKDGETPAIIHHRDPKNISSWERNPSISIAELEEILTELNAEGADRVQIFYHGDHEEYHFVGTHLQQELDPEDEMKLRISVLLDDHHQQQHYLAQCKSNVTEWEKRVQKSQQAVDDAEKELETLVRRRVGRMTRAEFEIYLKENGI